MIINKAKAGIAVAIAGVLVAGCASSLNPFAREADERWADYKTWTKITEGKTGTGDPTGLIKTVHKGPDGYRDVYVNDIGKAALEGSAPYLFPAGTVVVKEQFGSKADWEAGKNAGITVSVKSTAGDAVNRDDWVWADSYTAKAGASAFCSGCHTAAIASDFVFTHADFLAAQ